MKPAIKPACCLALALGSPFATALSWQQTT
jgi:hypothetical protein